MTALRMKDGKLLISGGDLAVSDNCCCDCCNRLVPCVLCADAPNGYMKVRATIAGVVARPDGDDNCGTGITEVCSGIDGTYEMCAAYYTFMDPEDDLTGSCQFNGYTTSPIAYPHCSGVDSTSSDAVWLDFWMECDSAGNSSIIASTSGGLLAYWGYTDDASARTAISSLCAGGTAELPAITTYGVGLGPYCDATSSTLTVELYCDSVACDELSPSCSYLEYCIENSGQILTAYITGLSTHVADHLSDFEPHTITYSLDNMNRGYVLELATSSDPLGAGYVENSNPYLFYVPLGVEGNYADPGIKIATYDYTLINFEREVYVYGMYVRMDCEAGDSAISHIIYLFQSFDGYTDATPGDVWPTHEWNDFITSIPTAEHTAESYACKTRTMQSDFTDEFSAFDTFGDAYSMLGQIGGFILG